jgi:excinuclease ABC subunit C
LKKEDIDAGKFKVCLEYHIHNCTAPCVGKQSYEEYIRNIEDIKKILGGETKEIAKAIYTAMEESAAAMRYEEAEMLKRKYMLIESYRAKSEVVNATLHNIDVFSIGEDGSKSAFINYLHITNGSINQAFTFEYKKRIDETKEDLLALGIAEMRERYGSKAKEIIIPFPIELEMKDVVFTIPQRGDKRHLLELSDQNVKQYKVDRLKQAEKLNPEQRAVRLMTEIQSQLHLKKLPMRIESFDNSNIQAVTL